jgi:uncharacterized membrane protein
VTTAGFVAATTVSACSSSPADQGGAGSPCVVAPACPDAGAPSYASEVQTIIQNDCVPCHNPSGTAGFNETSYTDVYNQYGSMLSQVNGCLMPPANGPQMTNAERVALTAWLRCGAPNN